MAGRIQPCEYQEESIPGGVTPQTTSPRQTQACAAKGTESGWHQPGGQRGEGKEREWRGMWLEDVG